MSFALSINYKISIFHSVSFFFLLLLFSNPSLLVHINDALGLSKLKAQIEDGKSNVTKNIKVVFHSIENIVGKEENAGYQHFLLFPTMFSKGFFLQCVKSRHCMVKG